MATSPFRYQPISPAAIGRPSRDGALAAATSATARIIRFLMAVALCCALPIAASAQPQPAATFGDWRMTCERPPGAQTEQCALVQSVRAADRDYIGLLVIIARTADREVVLMRVVAPMGVQLIPGIGLRIDGVDLGTTDYTRCVLETGCMAEVIVTDEMLDRLRNGTQAVFAISLTPEEFLGIPISLAGFREGFQALP